MTKVFDFIDEAREKLWLDKHDEIMALVDPKTNKVYHHMVSRVNFPICDSDDEFVLDDDVKKVLENYIDKKKMGYKLITISELT